MSDIGGKLKDASDAVRDTAEKKTASTRSGVMNALDQANQTVRTAADRSAEVLESGRRAAEQVRDSAVDTTASLTESFAAAIERQPFTAVAVAAAVGFLAGMMLRRG